MEHTNYQSFWNDKASSVRGAMIAVDGSADEETLARNVAGIRRQLEHFVDFDPAHPHAATLVNNYDWFRDISFIGFLRDVGKYLTVNYMMAKDSVKKRIEGETGISYTEFAYQLMQGFDFYWLYKNGRIYYLWASF